MTNKICGLTQSSGEEGLHTNKEGTQGGSRAHSTVHESPLHSYVNNLQRRYTRSIVGFISGSVEQSEGK